MNNIDTTFITIILTTGIIALLSIAGVLIHSRYQDRKQEQQEIEIYEQQIKVNPNSNLIKSNENILDLYEQSNIKIPVEIIEDLQYMNIEDEEEVFNFIENQRNSWRLENAKKLYRKK